MGMSSQSNNISLDQIGVLILVDQHVGEAALALQVLIDCLLVPDPGDAGEFTVLGLE